MKLVPKCRKLKINLVYEIKFVLPIGPKTVVYLLWRHLMFINSNFCGIHTNSSWRNGSALVSRADGPKFDSN